MTRNTTNALTSIAATAVIAMATLLPMAASAQEAITLETIGAVRMAQPSDMQAPNSRSQATPAPTDAARIERHADKQ